MGHSLIPWSYARFWRGQGVTVNAMRTNIPHFPDLARAALLCSLALAAGAAAAAGSHTVSVGATVLSKNKCSFENPGPTDLLFGAIDPSVAVNNTATALIAFKCVGKDSMVTYSITSGDGLYGTSGALRMRHATDPTQFLPYSLNLPQSATVPKGGPPGPPTTHTLTVTGTILPANFQNALVGLYTDTVILTIAP